ncbi:winged helix-turn-helix domain-containing protein [Budvicia aquatica]|uniref:DNA-binding transcriptional regulator CsiR n=1 Tax=Budvicia aquatica TaxID=82979 RepID=A0A484ZBT1_9GAMM|nr:winged helix-turn-helix domain-containing protein [Budvicia aquatica]VFS45902.1 DNA-binding transcriptional regulator CsiR [Budvicia aquatica]
MIYDDLKRRILSGELKADVRLVIHQLAVSYDSSDIPVREALKELAAEDLIEMSPHKGSRLRNFQSKNARYARDKKEP